MNNIIASGSSAVNELDFCPPRLAYILPPEFPMFGVVVSPLGKRAETDSLAFRLFVDEYPDLSFFTQVSENHWDCWLSDEASKQGKIVVSFYKIYGHKFFDVHLASLTRFGKGRSSAVFSINTGLKDRINAVRRFAELVNKRVPAYNREWFNPFGCQISRDDKFCDLRFESEGKRDALFDAARRLRFKHLPGDPLVYEETATDERSLIWTDRNTLEDSTVYLKLYVKKNIDPNRKPGDEENKLKLRLEVSRQKKGYSDPLRRSFEKDPRLRQETLNVETLLKQSVINRLYLSVAAPFFEFAELGDLYKTMQKTLDKF